VRIEGRVVVDAPIADVWAILTDYDNLSTHVPNLIESKRVSQDTGRDRQGSGTYKCRLYQRGAQKIIGFQFGADVVMNMAESTLGDYERKIYFQCAESLFFSEFDGEWRIESNRDNTTTMYYVVDVRPKGPVPVAALEWRIKEDVPTNMEAVRDAAMRRRRNAMLLSREDISNVIVNTIPINTARIAIKAGEKITNTRGSIVSDTRRKLKWGDDETLAAYLPF